jgi:hypothetical protein
MVVPPGSQDTVPVLFRRNVPVPFRELICSSGTIPNQFILFPTGSVNYEEALDEKEKNNCSSYFPSTVRVFAPASHTVPAWGLGVVPL